MPQALTSTAPSLPPQRRALGLACLAALALHALLLLGWPRFSSMVRAGSAQGTLITRVIAPTPAAQPATPATPSDPPATPAPVPRPTPPPKSVPVKPRGGAGSATSKPAAVPAPAARGIAGGSDSLLASLLDAPPLADFGGSRPDVPLQPSLEGDAARQAEAFAGAADAQPAVVPRGATVDYRVSGTLGGQAVSEVSTLAWRRTDTFYEADWDGASAARANVRLASAGLITGQGQLLPVFGGARTGDAVPARFDYAERSVRFSRPEAVAPLQPGTQDALSAIIQLGAWLAGDRGRFAAGQTFTLPVADGGSVRSWRWLVDPETSVTTLGGHDTPAVKLIHIPLGDDGTQPRMEVWLAPALDYLPARLRLHWPNGDLLDQVASTARLNRASDETRPPRPAASQP